MTMEHEASRVERVDELERLLILAYGGDAEADEIEQLNSLLRGDKDLRMHAIQFLRDGALLRRELQVCYASELLTPDAAAMSATGPREERRTIGKWLAACAAAAVVVMGLAFSYTMINRGPTGPNLTGQPAVATLTETVDVQWSQDPSTISQLDVFAGSLSLESGIVALTLSQGVEIAVEGPAEFELLADGNMRLSHGHLTANVPEDAIGFHVDTATARVIDLGTAFGVASDADGQTKVCVFKGEVVVRSDSSSLLMKEGEAAGVGTTVITEIASVPYDVGPFEDSWRVSSGVRSIDGPVKFAPPGPPWDLAAYKDDSHLIVFPEGRDVELEESIQVAITEPGTYKKLELANEQLYPQEKKLTSYLLQYRPANPPPAEEVVTLEGTVTFSAPIVAIIARTHQLKVTDPIFGEEGSDYSDNTDYVDKRFRGLERIDAIDDVKQERFYESVDGKYAVGDYLRLDEDRHTLFVRLATDSYADQIRVLVEGDSMQ